uniref:Uncharacterized protein n=1 Tax=Leersia perrieri TaxID=77586 RepID=A0A0D9X5G6_9ORYZ
MRPAAPILLARTTAARLTGMHRPLLLARTAEARSSGIRRRPVAPLLPTARTMAARSNGIGRQLGDCGGAAPLPPARPTTARSIRMRQQLSNGGSAGGGSAPPGVDGGCEFKRDAAGGSAPPVMPLATMTHQRRRQHRDSGNGRGRVCPLLRLPRTGVRSASPPTRCSCRTASARRSITSSTTSPHSSPPWLSGSSPRGGSRCSAWPSSRVPAIAFAGGLYAYTLTGLTSRVF